MKRRVILIIIDSLGVGYMEDVIKVRIQDKGANTFYHILDKAVKIEIPNLEKLGINKILEHPRLKCTDNIASYGTLNLQHYGADSYAGHQEIMGSLPKQPLLKPFKLSIDKVMKALENEGYKVEIPNIEEPYLLVNDLVVIADNIETDYGQIYNVTAPLDYISFEKVLEIGKIVRKNVDVSRIIALGGQDINIEKIISSIEKRKDGLVGVNCPKSGVYNKGYQVRHMGYGVNPDKQICNILVKSNKEVTLIGKMQDIIQCEGANRIPAVDTKYVMEEVLRNLDIMEEGLIAATIQETDLAGHEENVDKYSNLIMIIDKYLGTVLDKLTIEDTLIISADHGNDPTIGHSQHTREKTFLLVYNKISKVTYLGDRKTLSDIAASISEYFNVEYPQNGNSFIKQVGI